MEHRTMQGKTSSSVLGSPGHELDHRQIAFSAVGLLGRNQPFACGVLGLIP
jgi:hypothetical protein